MLRRYSIFVVLTFFLCSFSTPKGFHYQHIKTDAPQSIHVFQVDPAYFEIVPARALDKCVGRESVLSLSKRKGAFGAINGGFFDIGGSREGLPCGILKINHVWYGLPSKPRGAIGWKKGSDEVIFDRVLTRLEGLDFHVDPQTDFTSTGQWELMDHIVGGAPILIQNGERVTDFTPEKTIESFLTLRHARTAVGILPSGEWVFVVVDGKQPDLSLGMTMEELAQFMEELGCIGALNLDGGGSSTCVLQDQIVNRPIGDEDEGDGEHMIRRVSDAILILPTNN